LNANPPYLSIEALTVSYGATRVLDCVSLGVERGEMIALLGSSGCGKTTLLRAIAGFVRPESGTIRVGGKEITHLPPEARGTAMMFQSYALWPHMNVADNIAYGLRMRSWTKPAMSRRVVVLPEPDGPSIEKNSPSATSRSRRSTATTSP